MTNDGKTNTKLIAIHSNDYKFENIQTLDRILKKLNWNIFSKCKNWKKLFLF